MKNPRLLFAFIIVLTLLAAFINLPGRINLPGFTRDIKYDSNFVLQRLNIPREISFRQGLDLKGGVSLNFKAEVEKLPAGEREQALESAREVIERRINLFGVSEPLIQTA